MTGLTELPLKTTQRETASRLSPSTRGIGILPVRQRIYQRIPKIIATLTISIRLGPTLSVEGLCYSFYHLARRRVVWRSD